MWIASCQRGPSCFEPGPDQFHFFNLQFLGGGDLTFLVRLYALAHLCASLRGGQLSYRQRAERAWTAGCRGRFVLEGRVGKPRPSSPCDLANTTYLVVRAEGLTEAVVCETAADYRSLAGEINSPGSFYFTDSPPSVLPGTGNPLPGEGV